MATRAGISLRQAKRLDAELDGRKPAARRAALLEPEPAKAEPAIVPVVADPAPPVAAEQEAAAETSWSAFVRLDRADQLAFTRRALAHLGIDPSRFDAVLADVEEAEPTAPAVERPAAVAEPAADPTAGSAARVLEPVAAPEPRVSAAETDPPTVGEPEPDAGMVTVHDATLKPSGPPHLYAGAERLPRRRMERAGYSPAGPHTYKGVPGTLLRNGDGVVTYWTGL